MVRKEDGCDAVEDGHLDLPLGLQLVIASRHPESGVVDEKTDFEIGRFLNDTLAPSVGGEVGVDDAGGSSRGGPDVLADCLQTIGPSGDENDVQTAASELPSEFGPDPR